MAGVMLRNSQARSRRPWSVLHVLWNTESPRKPPSWTEHEYTLQPVSHPRALARHARDETISQMDHPALALPASGHSTLTRDQLCPFWFVHSPDPQDSMGIIKWLLFHSTRFEGGLYVDNTTWAVLHPLGGTSHGKMKKHTKPVAYISISVIQTTVTKYHRLGSLFISWFWRLEVQDQAGDMVS